MVILELAATSRGAMREGREDGCMTIGAEPDWARGEVGEVHRKEWDPDLVGRQEQERRRCKKEEGRNQIGQEEFHTNQSPEVRSWMSQPTSLENPHWKLSRQW